MPGTWQSIKQTLSSRTFQLSWFLFFYAGSVACVLAVALGCLSKPTAGIFTYKVDMHDFGTRLATRADVNASAFLHPDLPNTWKWGYSGVCFETSGQVANCKYGFPPIWTSESLLKHALRDASDKNATASTIETWANALPSTSLVPNANRSKFLTTSRAAAALLILSLLTAFMNFLCTSLCLFDVPRMKKYWPWASLSLMFVDWALVIGVLGLTQTIKETNEVAWGVTSGWSIYDAADESLGPVFAVLVVGIAIKFATIPWVGPLVLIVSLLMAWYFVKSLNWFLKREERARAEDAMRMRAPGE